MRPQTLILLFFLIFFACSDHEKTGSLKEIGLLLLGGQGSEPDPSIPAPGSWTIDDDKQDPQTTTDTGSDSNTTTDETTTQEVIQGITVDNEDNTDSVINQGVTITPLDVNDTGDEEDIFAFEMSTALSFHLSFMNGVTATSDVMVQFHLEEPEIENQVLFQAKSDDDGKISGSISIPKVYETVLLKVIAGDKIFTESILLEGLSSIKRVFEIKAPGVDTSVTDLKTPDRDLDGIPDALDQFPDDSNLASLVISPPEEDGTVAFEDLFPARGDADFNDYVVSYRVKEYLDASGKIKMIEGYFRHLARGAGYKHELYITPPSGEIESIQVTQYGFEGFFEMESSFDPSSPVLLLPSSDTTLNGGMVYSGSNYQKGKTSVLKIVYSTPAERNSAGAAPYDLFIKVLNNGREVHMPGYFTDKGGNDLYIDDEGFPWALVIPGIWNWPYESHPVGDTESKTGCYPEFNDWLLSAGKTQLDWYNHWNQDCVFPYTSVKPGDAEEMLYEISPF